MMSIHTNKSTRRDGTERNLDVNGRSAFSTDMVFKSRQDLMDWVQNVGRSLGYVVLTKRSKKRASGIMSKVILMCDRGGIYRSNKSSGKNTRSKKINCPFELEGKYSKRYGFWTLVVICDNHNHEPAPQMEGHPYVMRLSDYETRLVDELSRKNVKPQDILSILKEQNPNNLSTLRTIYNARQKIRRTKHAETSMGQLINSEESASRPLYTGPTFNANKSKSTIDHADLFAISNGVQEPDSTMYGSVTKDIEDLFLREQTLMPHFRRFPSFQANLMETNPAKEVYNTYPARDAVVMHDEGNSHDINAPDADVIAISDVDVSTSMTPFQLYRDVILDKPEGQFLMEQFLEGDYVHGQSSACKGGGGRSGDGGRGRGSAQVGREGGESVQGSKTSTLVEPKNEEPKNVINDVKVEKKYDKDEYVGVQSYSDMEQYDSQSDVNFDGLADIRKEMTVGLESSKDAVMDLLINKHTKEDEKECDHFFILKEDIGHVCRVCGVTERSIESLFEFQRPKVFKSRQDLMDWVQHVGRSLGYVIVTRRSKTRPNGVTSNVRLICDRGGIYKSSKSSSRNTKSRKINCPFQLEGKYSKRHGFWTLIVICDKHNHEPALHMEGHPYVMRLSEHETRLVDELSRKNVKPQDILSILKERNPNNLSTLKTIYNARQKIRRTKQAETSMGQLINSEESASPSPPYTGPTFHAYKSKRTIDRSDPLAIRNWVQYVDSANYGSVTKDIEQLLFLKEQMLMPGFRRFPSFQTNLMETNTETDVSNANPVRNVVAIHSDGNDHAINAPDGDVIASSDVDVPTSARPFQPYQDVILNKPEGHFLMKQFLEGDYVVSQSSAGKGGSGGEIGRWTGQVGREGEGESVEGSETNTSVENNEEHKDVDNDVEVEKKHDKGEYVGVQSDSDMEENDSQSDVNFDGLADIWKEMSFGLESSKAAVMDLSIKKHTKKDEEECDHFYILKEDIGYVCRVCGVIERSIESIIEFQRPKSSKSARTYCYEGRSDKSKELCVAVLDGVKSPGKNFSVVAVSAHPRHKKQMKPHQVEGFNFLTNNLVSENPGGCILAHAPGSGKTFMLISFLQSFMAKYPDARPLVVLPRGILATWKKEFKRWQVEDMPLLDCYSSKADNRAQQLEVLKEWANMRSILFIGYKQFSTIVCDNDRSPVSVTCQEILLTYPSILILDEGHTPRNQDTDVFTSVEKVQTPRKVVLSGTLYQNHVKEVFNILNLVRPKFLRMEDSKMIKRRILSRVPIESQRNLFKKVTDSDFYEVVEHTLLKDENFKRKVTVIEDLREMTSKVLHYYKGDFLDELPGYMDFSVFLKLSPRQKQEVHELEKLGRKFKVSSDGSAIYVHPELKSLVRTVSKDRNDDYNYNKIDELLEKLDEREGVKAKFFLNLLRLCESTGERLLVFGNYLLPLNFLLRLTVKVKGWHLGKQIFMITGDHGIDEREVAMDQFNNSSDAKVFFGSIKACGEGISLVGASRIIILDVHLNPSVTRQAIGRAFRPGQVRKVYTYRLVAANSPEEEDHITCFRKESIAKMWFEWNEYCGHHAFEMETIDVKDCGDQFLETPWLNEDVAALSKRLVTYFSFIKKWQNGWVRRDGKWVWVNTLFFRKGWVSPLRLYIFSSC